MLSPRAPFVVPEDAQLADPHVLMTHLLEASAYARGSVDGAGFARLLEAAAQLIQQQAAENKVQRGLAIASQTLASELAIKCEQMQIGGALHDPSPHHSPRAIAAAPATQVATTSMSHSPAGGLPQAPQPSPTGPPVNPVAAHAAVIAVASAEEQAPMRTADVRAGPNTWMEGGSDRWQHAAGDKRSSANATFTTRDAPLASDPEEERQVDTMVVNLKARFKQSRVTLPLEKHQGTVYRLGSRKLQLSIRSSRLMVRVGSTYCDFLEYLSKAAL
uniref:Uncharacterized protein n=1 Tax=Haptolina brevifila TaxID=156173 RepID=A0A7S2IC50_9EUKA|mmetsp:Transcript_64077/g.126638  ORF Transcript_64077/g.126638 Transcript_64077/m.126638 type:complete len:274 (+) Transcript_64077:85-906(+)